MLATMLPHLGDLLVIMLSPGKDVIPMSNVIRHDRGTVLPSFECRLDVYLAAVLRHSVGKQVPLDRLGLM